MVSSRTKLSILTSHVDIRGASHVPSRENDEIENVANDSEATDRWQYDTVTDTVERRDSWVLEDLEVFR